MVSEGLGKFEMHERTSKEVLLPLWKTECIYTISALLHASSKVTELVYLGNERDGEERKEQHTCYSQYYGDRILINKLRMCAMPV